MAPVENVVAESRPHTNDDESVVDSNISFNKFYWEKCKLTHPSWRTHARTSVDHCWNSTSPRRHPFTGHHSICGLIFLMTLFFNRFDRQCVGALTCDCVRIRMTFLVCLSRQFYGAATGRIQSHYWKLLFLISLRIFSRFDWIMSMRFGDVDFFALKRNFQVETDFAAWRLFLSLSSRRTNSRDFPEENKNRAITLLGQTVSPSQ